MTEFKCVLNKEKNCNDCNDCIICYDCIYCLEKMENDKVVCDVKGIVDVHSICNFHKKTIFGDE